MSKLILVCLLLLGGCYFDGGRGGGHHDGYRGNYRQGALSPALVTYVSAYPGCNKNGHYCRKPHHYSPHRYSPNHT